MTLALLEKPEILSRFGRPFFHAFFMAYRDAYTQAFPPAPVPSVLDVDHSKVASKALIGLLKMKILGGGLAGKKIDLKTLKLASGKEFSKAQVLAVLGSIVSLEISASAEMASELASEHMRLVAGISEDRKCVYTLEVSEPFLALAGHRIIMDKVLSWEIILGKFGLASLRSSTSIGFRGEVATMILYSMAWQCLLPKDTWNFPSVSAHLLLRRLLSKPLAKLDQNAPSQPPPAKRSRLAAAAIEHESQSSATWSEVEDSLKFCQVRVNQTVKSFAHPTKTMLFENFIRSTAIACKENQTGFDHIIPMAQLDDPTARVTEEAMTAIVIDSKLRKAFLDYSEVDLWMKKAVTALSKIVSDSLPKIAILLEYGPKTIDPVSGSVMIRRTPGFNGFFLLCRRLSPADIFEDQNIDGSLNIAFLRLLESTIDPRVSQNISKTDRTEMMDMFQGQPFGFGPKEDSNSVQKTTNKT
jgi:hypothetical protein